MTNTSNPVFTLTVKGNPVSFTSAFATLAEAYHYLSTCEKLSAFATELLERARARKLSPIQVEWLHKIATDKKGAENDTSLLPLVNLLTRAAAAQKRAPKIRLEADGQPVVLKLVNGGNNAGTVSITDGAGFRQGLYYGRITAAGALEPGRSITDNLRQLLLELAKNPAAVASQNGVATGECCFCCRPLSTIESRTVGYGPDCADKFGLPWGQVSVKAAVAAKLEEITGTDGRRPSLPVVEEKRDHTDLGRAAWRAENPFRRSL